MVHRVRKLLRLKANRPVRLHKRAALARNALEEIRRIQLHTRHIRRDIHRDSALRTVQLRRVASRQREIVVIAVPDGKLPVVRADIAPDGLRRAEVKRRPRDGDESAGWQAILVVLGEAFGIDAQLMRQRRAAAREIEIAVVREADDRIRVRDSVIRYAQAALGQRVGHGDVQIARIALLAVRRQTAEAYMIGSGFGAPHAPVEAAQTAMQMVRPGVPGEDIAPAVQLELPAADAVGVSADRRAGVALAPFVFARALVAEHDVHRARPPRHDERLERRPVVEQHGAHRPAADAECRDLRAVGQRAEREFINGHFLYLFSLKKSFSSRADSSARTLPNTAGRCP